MHYFRTNRPKRYDNDGDDDNVMNIHRAPAILTIKHTLIIIINTKAVIKMNS